MSGEERMRAYAKKLREEAIPTTHISGSGKVHLHGIGDVSVSGSGFVSPEEIRISGSGRLPGGIKVRKIGSSGSVYIEGDVEAEEMRFSGSASVAGSVRARYLFSSGSFSAGGEADGELMKFSGSCKIDEGIKLADTLRAHGSLRVSGDVKAKNLVEVHGSFEVNGKIVAEKLQAELSRLSSHVRNGIEAIDVCVKKKEFPSFVLFGIPILGRRFRGVKLYTTDIVAKGKVYIENVSCNNVYGSDVTIGEGCKVKGKVKYSKSISVDSKAKLANPPGKSSQK